MRRGGKRALPCAVFYSGAVIAGRGTDSIEKFCYLSIVPFCFCLQSQAVDGSINSTIDSGKIPFKRETGIRKPDKKKELKI